MGTIETVAVASESGGAFVRLPPEREVHDMRDTDDDGKHD